MMENFVVATKNKGKLGEIREILADFPFRVASMEEVGIGHEIDETGNTFEENALIKAREVSKLCGEIVMADDSGLEVDYLNGGPGIYTSRYAGEGASDADRNKKLLRALEGVPFAERTARFVCAVAVVFPDGRYFTATGTCDGYIGLQPEGANGFGYDPLFYLPEYGMTTAQLPGELKNQVSHRGRALRLMNEKLKEYMSVSTEGIRG